MPRWRSAQTRRLKAPAASRPHFEELEPRVLYSADLAPTGLPGWAPSAEVRQLDTRLSDSADNAYASQQQQDVRLEIVFVDTRIDDYQRLLDNLTQQPDANRELRVVLLDAEQDGIDAISRSLAEQPRDVAAVHLISHGDPGHLQLGASSLDLNNVEERQEQLRSWALSLGSDADLLIYGCDVAATPDGQALIERLAQLTGADVAASNDKTGNAEAGGDWLLEYRSGTVETTLAVSAYGIAGWNSVLATYVVTSTADSGANTLRQAILNANANAGADSITFNIAGTGVHTITLASALPTITGTVSLDASSDDSFIPNGSRPAIVLQGDGSMTNGIYLDAGSSGSTLSGFVIKGFQVGIYIAELSDNNVISGNYVGQLNPDGSLGGASTNTWGIIVQGSGNVIGGTGAADRNIVSGNTAYNIGLDAVSTTGNFVQGNYIGTNSSGAVSGSGGTFGVLIQAGANNNLVGGTTAAEANLIAGHTDSGIRVATTAGTANTLLGNSIHSNGFEGIDLGGVGVTANDAGDGDGGANNLQNFPVLSEALTNGTSSVTVTGTLNSNANSYYRVEFFANATADSSGYGEGQIYLGFVNVTTNASGDATFSTTLSGIAVPDGYAVSATATRSNATFSTFTDTSEFSQNVVASSNGLIVDTTADNLDGDTSSISALLASKGADGRISLREAITAANNTANGGVPDQISFAIPGTGVHTITLGSILPTINQAVVIDATTDDSFATNSNRPAIIIDGNDLTGNGLRLGASADGSSIRGLVIRNFSGNGIQIDAGSDSHLIVGNYIGSFDSSGQLAAGTGMSGTQATGNGIYSEGDNVIIGGSSAADRNLIGGNASDGIDVRNAPGTQILGNWIGISGDGVTSMTNAVNGVYVLNSSGIEIGGTSASDGNWITGGTGNAVQVEDTSNALLQNNRMGTDLTGTLNWGNTASTISFNGTGSGSKVLDNIIAFGGRRGVALESGITATTISENSIYGNAELGIDLSVNDVSANDTGDADTGANNLQNFPVLTLAETDGSSTVELTGTLNSSASSYFRIEFFANPSADSSGYGEGQIYLGYVDVATNVSGNASFSTTLSAAVPVGYVISATATKANATYTTFTDTSEFARNVVAISSIQGEVVVTTASDTTDGDTTSLSTLLANKGADGEISLREAITAANNTANGATPDEISFAIAGTGVHTITLGSALPNITEGVVINATTDDSFAANGNRPAVVINGNGLNVVGLRLSATADGSTIRGLVIRNFGDSAIRIDAGSDGNTIAGNYLGAVDATGNQGTSVNASYTLFVAGASNTIGGSTAADSNVLGTNGASLVYGVLVTGATATGNQILGNYIGIGADGSTAFSGIQPGIAVQSGAATTRIEGNVITADGDYGVYLNTTGAGTVVHDNLIGTNAAGTAMVSAPINGLWAVSAGANTVITNNVIAGASESGIRADDTAGGLTIQGNRIGTDAAGTANWGVQWWGMVIRSSNNLIGGTSPGQGNIVANSNQAATQYDGISVPFATAVGNAILGNSIYGTVAGTSGLGINLGIGGVSANDTGDGDNSSNNLQNFPVLSWATSNGTDTVTVSGSLNSTANSYFRIEFFANPTVDASGYGEGQTYLGFANVAADGSGDAPFTTTLSAAVPVGYVVSATATKSDATYSTFTDTSEFAQSETIVADAEGIIVVTTAADTLDGDTTSLTTLLANKGVDGEISLREAITAANNTANSGGVPDTINFGISGTGVHTITLGSLLPTINDAVVINATTDDSFSANGNKPAIVLDGNNLNTSGLTLSSTADGSTIRGLLITHFQQSGIRIEAGSDGNAIAGNYIGQLTTSGTLGTTTLGQNGIYIEGTNNTIGGANTADRNIFAGITNEAIEINGEASDGNIIQGNWIGLAANGTTVLGTNQYGIYIQNGADNTLIGGSTLGQGNVIVSAGGLAISIDGATSGTLIRGNYLGTDSTLSVSAGNYDNINLAGGAHDNMIGGTGVNDGNYLANSDWNGIYLWANTGTGNAFLGNRIWNSGKIGIDLVGGSENSNGITANDAGDADTGANNLQNFPVLTLAKTDGSNITVAGTLNSTANSHFRIELFANPTADASGFGEGQVYLGFVNVATDGSGNASFSTTMTAAIPAGYIISATATKSDATYSTFTDTSEFARNVVAISSTQGVLVVDTASDTSDGDNTSLSTLLANKGADGFISLREAITAANNTANGAQADKIEFAIAGTGTHTITLASALPTITDTVILDASTDDSFAANGNRPAIVLDGINAGPQSGFYLRADADGSTIRGLVITNFQHHGIYIEAGSDGHTIAGNYIGKLGADGAVGGTGNGQGGIVVYGSNSTIGGGDAERNVIGGNGVHGIWVVGGSGNDILGNYIGTDASGNTANGNAFNGIQIQDGGTGNVVAFNVIAASGLDGIAVHGETSDGNIILGNRIGLGADGTTVLGVGFDGIYLYEGADNTVIGGANPGEGNVIVGALWGISVDGASSGTVVRGNFIGTDEGLALAGGNADGIVLQNGASDNLIGGTATADRNQIANSAGYGITLQSTAGAGNAILGNSIWNNGQMAIDIGPTGVTANDAGDADTGANNLQNFPVLTLATTDGSDITLAGSLNSTANSHYRIEFFANPTADASGFGEGQIYLGFVNVATDGSGNASFSTTLTAAIPAGYTLSATATKSDATYSTFTDTSEFARNVVAISSTQGVLVVDTASDTSDGDTTSLSTLIANKGADGFISLREAITAANNTANGTQADQISFAIAGTGTHTITLTSALPSITDAVILDATTDDSFAPNSSRPAIALDGGGTISNGLTLAAGSDGSTVRGLQISGFSSAAISLNSNGNVVAGNYIGALTATGAFGGTGNYNGIGISGNDNTIGGTVAADRNVISGNSNRSISLEGSTPTGNRIIGNYIGTVDATGATGTPVTIAGVVVIAGNNTQIGGTGAGEGNLITGLSGYGVSITSGTGHAVLGNAIHGNDVLGINLGANGVTPNDLDDGDTGANDLQNFPILTLATTDGSDISIAGTLNSTANSHFRFEFFASPTADASGYGEGQIYLGFVNVATDGSGNATFSTTIATAVPAGYAISATATKSDATYSSFTDTSEFARNVVAISSTQGVLVVDTASDTSDGDTTSLSTLLANKGADGFISLREAITAANNTANGTQADQISFAIAGNGTHTITLTSALPSITDAVILDASTDDSFAANSNRPAIVLDGNNLNSNGLTLTNSADGSTIRGLLITDFQQHGIHIEAGSDGNTLAGNYIGQLTPSGTLGTSTVGVDGIHIEGSNNIIGSATVADRNLIAGTTGDAIAIAGEASDGNIIQGNWIGLGADGTTVLGTGSDGIYISGGGDNNLIGGSNSGEGNTVVGVDWAIWINGLSSGNVIRGNFVGTDSSLTVAGGNNNNVVLEGGAFDNMVGGTGATDGNFITNSALNGIDLNLDAGAGNALLGNLIWNNAGLGIDLAAAGVQGNDLGDADTGANNRQNFPILTAATTNGASIDIAGTLNSTANSYFRIELFASSTADATNFGEGQIYLGFVNVETDGSGNATFSTTLAASVPVGYKISATATKSDATYSTFTDTSEFSFAMSASAVNAAPVITSNGSGATAAINVAENTTSVTTVTATDADLPAQTLSYSITGGADQGLFSIDVNTGELTFNAAPNFELPGDLGGNNVYDVTVQVSDGNGGTDSQAISVTVTNANEAPTVANAIPDQNATEDSAFSFQFAANTFADADVANTLTYSAQLAGGGALPAWLSFDAGTRTFSGTPLNAHVGTVSIDVTANDGNGGTVTDTFDIVIANSNDAPTVTNAIPNQNATEDSAFSFQFAANTFSDVDVGATLTYTAQISGGGALPGWLSFDALTRTFSGTPANANVGTISIDVTANDGNGGTVTDTFDIVVANSNDAPTVANSILDQNATENTPFNFTFAVNTFNDQDVGDTLTYSAQLNGGGALPAWLSFDAATRSFSGTPANADVGTISIDVIASDGNGGTVTDTFDITVGNTNDSPFVATPIPNQNATEDAAFNFQFAANTFDDPDVGDTLTYTTSLLPAWLSFDSVTRTFSGTPANADVGTISVTVTATDGTGHTVSDTFDLVVSNTNDAPTVANTMADQNATENAAFNYTFAVNTFNDSDVGDTLTYSAQLAGGGALPAWLSFDSATRTFSGTPTNANVGTVSIDVIANDGNGGTVTDTFDITVGNTNDAPFVANPIPNQNATEDAAFNFQFAANTFDDPDVSDTLTYTAQIAGGGALPAWLSFDAATRTFSGTPANADVGTISIDVIANDGHGGTVTDTFDIVIANTNDAPTVANAIPNQNATEDAAFSFQFAVNTFNDVDVGATLTYSTQLNGGGALPAWLSFDPVTRTFSGTPTNTDVGTISIDVTASDGNGGTVTDTFDITVTNANDAPTVANTIPNQNATEDAAFSFQFAANTFADQDVGDTLTYSVSGAPAWLSFDSVTRTFSGTPANTDVGTISIAVTATDGAGLTASDTFDITVINTNDAPTVAITIADQNAFENISFNFVFAANTFNDIDVGNLLTYSTSALPAWLSFDAATRTFSGTPLSTDIGTVSIDVIANDGNGGTVTDTFNITVGNSNDAPTVANAIPNQNATEDAAFSFQFAANTFADPDIGDTLTYSVSALPTWLSFDANTRTFSGTPLNADVGTISIAVTATDGAGLTASDTFDLTVTNTNDAPTVANAIPNQNASANAAFNFTFAANAFNDIDVGDTLTYSVSALPAWLNFDANTRTFSGTPGNADVGSVSVTVTASDGAGQTSSDTFDIVVGNTVNNAPSLANPIPDQNAAEENSFSFTFPINTFADPDIGDTLTYSASGLPGWLSFDAGTRTFTGTPTNADVGSVSITVTASDSSGLTASDTFNIVVGNVNVAPTTTPVTLTAMAEDSGPRLITQAELLSQASDADGDTLVASNLSIVSGGGSLIDNLNGTWSYTPAANDDSSVTFGYRISDGAETISTSASLDLTPVNDSPSGLPIISGSASESQTLTVLTNGISDAEGLGAFSYQWRANGVDISGANATTLTLKSTLVGKTITVVVTYQDGSGAQEIVSSAAIGPVAALPVTPETPPPTPAPEPDKPTPPTKPAPDESGGEDDETPTSPPPSPQPEPETDSETTPDDSGLTGNPNLSGGSGLGNPLPFLVTQVNLLGASPLNLIGNTQTPVQPIRREDVATLMPIPESELSFNMMTLQTTELSSSRQEEFSLRRLADEEVNRNVAEVDLTTRTLQIGGLALSTLAAAWAVRMSGIMASLMISMPIWRNIDPMPILHQSNKIRRDWLEDLPDERDFHTRSDAEDIPAQAEGNRI